MSLLTLARFCRLHGTPKLRASKPLALTQYLAWATRQKFVITLQEGETITGVGIAWTVKDWGRNLANYGTGADLMTQQDPQSGLLYIANFTAPNAEGVRLMIEAASERWPQVERFLGHRTRRDGRETLVQYPLAAANRLYAIAHE